MRDPIGPTPELQFVPVAALGGEANRAAGVLEWTGVAGADWWRAENWNTGKPPQAGDEIELSTWGGAERRGQQR